MKKNESNKKNSIKKIVLIILILFIIGFVITKIVAKDDISSVSRVLNTEYNKISCINSNCDGLMATLKSKKKTMVKILDSKGRAVGKYIYKNDEKNPYDPYDLTKNYILMTKKYKNKSEKYYVTNMYGKDCYSTENKLIKISDDYIIEQIPSKIDYEYKILDSKGKTIYQNIVNYETYDNNKYLYIQKDDNHFILNTKNNKTFNKYKVKEEIKDDDNHTLYLILTKTTNDLNYFFNIKYDEINSMGFSNYSIKKDKTLIVTRKETTNNTKYEISINGKEKKISSDKFVNVLIKDYNQKISREKYRLYSTSIFSDNQNKVIVDNLEEKSLGVLNIKDNKYEKIFDYTADKFNSTIDFIKSNNNEEYIQISCEETSCGEPKMVVFNASTGKTEFSIEGASKMISNYTQYENGYKVIKYSYNSENLDSKGKYTLLDSKNKEISTSNKEIKVIDSDNIIGTVSNEELLIYSTKKNKILNDENNLATLVRIDKKNYYRYKDATGKISIVNEKGSEIYSNSSGNLEYSNDNIYAIGNRNIKIYNVNSDKVSTYKLASGESITNNSDKSILPFNSALFVNNSKKNYIKIIDERARIIRKIKKSSISNLKTNEKAKRAFIIVSSTKNKKTTYGLFVAK